VPLTKVGYGKNRPSFWGGENESETPAFDNQVYDGVIVRTAWNKANNTFFRNLSRPIPFARITDGTSHTFLLGEKYVRTDLYEGGGFSDDRGWADGWDPDGIRSTCFQPYQDGDPAGFQADPLNTASDFFGLGADVYYFGSAHPGGFNGVFADGSVHTLNYDVDVVLLNALATRAGDELIDQSAVD
jgi:prepilin-type processing-associated H-X9-DG protein